MMPKYCPNCGHYLEVYGPCTVALTGRFRCSNCTWAGHPGCTKDEPRIVGNTPYVSIDLETTGLDPETCQIIEFGAVYDDCKSPLADLPAFHRYVKHDHYHGEPYALSMNSKILATLSGPTYEDDFTDIAHLGQEFLFWLGSLTSGIRQIAPAGKNFASFDLAFLREINFPKMSHRCIDVGTLYWRPEDEKMPDTKTCMERAGLGSEVAHTALEDARVVVQLIRYGLSQK